MRFARIEVANSVYDADDKSGGLYCDKVVSKAAEGGA